MIWLAIVRNRWPGSGGPAPLQPRIDRLALHRQHAEHALMHPRQRCMRHEAMQRFQPQREFAKRHGALVPQAALLQPFEFLRAIIMRAVDDPQILPAAAFDGGLEQFSSRTVT